MSEDGRVHSVNILELQAKAEKYDRIVSQINGWPRDKCERCDQIKAIIDEEVNRE